MREAKFEGEFVRLLPYVRGYYDRDFLYKLWTLIEADGDWPRIYWNNPYDHHTPVAKFGDLVDWIAFVETGQKAWNIAIAKDSGEICGLVWFDKANEVSANGNIWIARKYRGGGYARDTVRLGTEYGLYTRGWQILFTGSPWHMARNLVRRCGWKPVEELSETHSVCGEPTTIYYSQITREDYELWEAAEKADRQVYQKAPATYSRLRY